MYIGFNKCSYYLFPCESLARKFCLPDIIEPMVIYDSDTIGIWIGDPISKYQDNPFGFG